MSTLKTWTWPAVVFLQIAQVTLITYALHSESLTFDEPDHMYAGYRMWIAADYGLNPEHPPLVKLLAALPIAGEKLWNPPPLNIYFKLEAPTLGGLFIEHNDDRDHRLVLRMRLATALLALALSLLIFLAAREWFGISAALIALCYAVFDPNLLAHSGLVTTDLGCALFFLAAVYTFYRYVQQPSWARLILAGIAAGLLLATKHSGILVAPILPILAAYEVLIASHGTRARLAIRLCGAVAVIAAISILVLWSFYGFRYAARPAGMQLVPSLSQYAAALSPFDRNLILTIAVFGRNFNTFAFGQWHPHGLWWYFPFVLTIKTTIALLAGLAVMLYASLRGKLRDRHRALAYVLIAGGVYLAVAIQNGLNIGVRHILPIYPLMAMLGGAGLAALSAHSRKWTYVALALLAAHIISSLVVYPNTIAYANEAWGGVPQIHHYLTDSNVDWAQQLNQVRQWQERHPGEECWFAYFAGASLPPESYGVTCHALPNGAQIFFRRPPNKDTAPPIIHGALLVSASEAAGSIYLSSKVNPYARFQSATPDEIIDGGVLVFRGDIPMQQAAAASRVLEVWNLLSRHQPALARAEEAAQIAPDYIYAQWALGDAAAAAGNKDEARTAYQKALAQTAEVEPERRSAFTAPIQAALSKL